MAKAAGKKPKEVILIIADISGYTKTMINNKKALEHAQAVITGLMKTIIRHVKIPLKVSKLEGDTVFLYSLKKGGGMSWEERKKIIKEKLPAFFRDFSKRAVELAYSTTCKCNACTRAEQLKLKIVIHSGKALFYKAQKFYELSGPDVIKVHRLLKNSVEQDEYVIFTEEAFNDLSISAPSIEEGEESYDIGTIKTKIYYPRGGTKPVISEKDKKKYSSLFYKIKNIFSKMLIMIPRMMKIKKYPVFKNIGAEENPVQAHAGPAAAPKPEPRPDPRPEPQPEPRPDPRMFSEPIIKPVGQAETEPRPGPQQEEKVQEPAEKKPKLDEFGLPILDDK